MNKNLSILLTVFLLFKCSYSQDLSLNLDLDKSEFLKGEPIRGFAFITNNSSAVSIYPIQGNQDLKLLIMDSTKNLLYERTGQQRLEYDKSVNFQQGETMGTLLGIGISIGNDSTHGIALREGWSVEPGKYFLQVKYTYHDHSIKSDDQKIYYSAIKEITVIKPQSETDKVVYKKLLELINQYIMSGVVGGEAVYAKLLLDLINKYPESGYFPAAYYNLFYSLDPKEYSKLDEVIENMLTKYPNSVMGTIAISWYKTHREMIFNSKDFYKKISNKVKERMMNFNKYNKELFKEMDASLQ